MINIYILYVTFHNFVRFRHILFYVFKPADRNCTSPNQQNITSQSDTGISDIVLSMRVLIFTNVYILIIIFVSDDMDVDEALEDAVISYVNMDARENGALSRRPQGMFVKILLQINVAFAHVT